MKGLWILIVFAVTVTVASAFTGAGIINEQSGDLILEEVSDCRLEFSGAPVTTPGNLYAGFPDRFFFTEAEVLWSKEEWHGTYGGICKDLDVSDDGAYVLCSWYLNYEKWEFYESAGDGTPVWTYDLCDGGAMTVGGDLNGDVSSDGSVVAGCVSGWRNSSGIYKGTLLKFGSSSSTPDWTYDFPYTSDDMYQSSRPADVRVSPDGSTIVCLVANESNLVKPHQLYIFDSSSSTPTLIIDLPDVDGAPGGLDITDDASRIVYSTYYHVNVYDDSGTQLNSFSVDHGWQMTPAISSDGQWMAYGNYHGELRLYEWNGSSYTFSWQHYIPPGTYYAWISSVDIVNDMLVMGSYEASEPDKHGYVYLFDTSSSVPIWKSNDSGHLVSQVALNSDASIAVASSRGPISGSGWRSALFNADDRIPYFILDQSYPGSHNACDISDDGMIAATGGKRVHSGVSGSGGWIYCIESTGTGIANPENPSGEFVSLNGIYPNPSSGTATISFGLLETSPTRLDIYDILGRRVTVLVDETLVKGVYERSVSDLVSGIYFCRLQAGDSIATQKLVVI